MNKDKLLKCMENTDYSDWTRAEVPESEKGYREWQFETQFGEFKVVLMERKRHLFEQCFKPNEVFYSMNDVEVYGKYGELVASVVKKGQWGSALPLLYGKLNQHFLNEDIKKYAGRKAEAVKRLDDALENMCMYIKMDESAKKFEDLLNDNKGDKK
ncbi:MAG: hypothetical protein ABIB71_05330 [Candidatus Woesearchaeota archaeon]